VKSIFLGAAAVLMVAAVQSASAADLPVRVETRAPALVASPVAIWNGFYVGASVGGRWSNVDSTTLSVAGLAPIANPTNTASFDSSTFRGGFYTGVNWQLASWVVGIEADIAWGDSKTTNTRLAGAGIVHAGDSATAKQTWDGGVRGRLGYLLTPSVLLFGTGGGSWIHDELTATCSAATCGAVLGSNVSTERLGWTVGGGVEWAMSPNWLLRGEYRYADYGTSRQTLFVGVPGSVSVIDSKLTTQTGLAGLAYKF